LWRLCRVIKPQKLTARQIELLKEFDQEDKGTASASSGKKGWGMGWS